MEHGRAPTQAFGAIGISRQYLSKLCMDGALVRVRYGFYRTPDQVRRSFANMPPVREDKRAARAAHRLDHPLPASRARAWSARIGSSMPVPGHH